MYRLNKVDPQIFIIFLTHYFLIYMCSGDSWNFKAGLSVLIIVGPVFLLLPVFIEARVCVNKR